MQFIQTSKHRKAFKLSLPPWHWASLVLTVGNLGYLPKYEWSHFGAMSASILTPLILCGMGAWHGWILTTVFIVLTCGIGHVAMTYLHHNGIPDDHDASAIVIDEVAGAAVAMLAVPLMLHVLGDASFGTALQCAWLVGWLFRACDIVKPYPAHVLDAAWEHPFSVIADDLVAGVYAALIGVGLAFVIAAVV